MNTAKANHHQPSTPITARSTATGQPSLHHLQQQYLIPLTQRRNAWFDWGRSKTGNTESKALTDELSKREHQRKLLDKLSSNTKGPSIFDEEIQDSERKAKEEARRYPGTRSQADAITGPSRMREHMERALDPDPRWRIRWQKKKVAQMVRDQGREKTPRELRLERIRATEKRQASTSSVMATSTKKLVHLAHQIVGKPVDDAITQMRYSKKKAAREVRWQLEEARDMAIATRGMGLGAAPGAKEGERVFDKPKKIQDKDGNWMEVADPTSLYVDESWVGKGPFRGGRIQYHSRGRMSMMWRPTARKFLVCPVPTCCYYMFLPPFSPLWFSETDES